jgi:hypothetical protein
MFSIKSNASDRQLTFLNLRADYFTVELRGSGVTAVRDVYAYRDAPALADVLARLAADKRPWRGTERWESLEGEFSLAAVCSPLGQVTFTIVVSERLGGPEDWRVSAGISTELGQLPRIAADAVSFFDAGASV